MKLLNMRDTKGKRRSVNVDTISSMTPVSSGTEVRLSSGEKFTVEHSVEKIMKRVTLARQHSV
jgi:uncharacterized protein YlzI (FlbEa/FlbD family)